MFNTSKSIRFLMIAGTAVAFGLVAGAFTTANAQRRDPFQKPGYAKPRTPKPSTGNGSTSTTPDKPKGPVVVAVPSIDQRISFYKLMREQAAVNGLPLPKVTSVLTLDEMSVTGIFRTPRGYAAMVEAKPIKLSYTIYPGEKFFDGQLVAVEENRLVFRKVTKMSDNKFISSVENKTLRQYSVQEEVQGTAPVGGSGATESAKYSAPAEPSPAPAPMMIIAPIDEMNMQPPADEKDAKSKGKKPVKLASRKKQ
jgi:hypothetical protein